MTSTAASARSPEELSAWLDEACADDEGLRAQVEKLLSYEDRLDAFRIAAPKARRLESEGSAIGEQVGPYRIRALLDSGGMGAVYRAERSEGFHQIVAVKRMRDGLESPRARERFDREREILAGLEHPNNAHLLDGGTGDDGRPYFAMKLVDGEPIDHYADDYRLSVRQRVELLLPVCEALRYAHRRLVIHRDLKPGNIFVNRDGVPKLLDFGIAKLLETEAAATETVARVMTPRYVLGEPVSTASDLYSLGVVLYQLLTGRLPCELDTCSTGRMLYAVCEQEPGRPSEVVMAAAEVGQGNEVRRLAPEAVVDARRTDPRTLVRQLRGDLDAIVLKALRKEPEERYSSVGRLADDLRRYLACRPVLARRGNFAYRAGKLCPPSPLQGGDGGGDGGHDPRLHGAPPPPAGAY